MPYNLATGRNAEKAAEALKAAEEAFLPDYPREGLSWRDSYSPDPKECAECGNLRFVPEGDYLCDECREAA
jgi:hypothetical protein